MGIAVLRVATGDEVELESMLSLGGASIAGAPNIVIAMVRLCLNLGKTAQGPWRCAAGGVFLRLFIYIQRPPAGGAGECGT